MGLDSTQKNEKGRKKTHNNGVVATAEVSSFESVRDPNLWS